MAGFAKDVTPAERLDERDGRIEMGPAHGAEERNQGGEHRDGGARIGEERGREISVRQALGHDPGADDRRGE